MDPSYMPSRKTFERAGMENISPLLITITFLVVSSCCHLHFACFSEINGQL